jgi:WD40 repeat protein
MPRIFLSHSSADGRAATALKQWLVGRDPSLKRQIFLDSDAHTGMVGGEEWEATLRRNLASCQALLCLISKNWEASKECHYEYKDADGRGKTMFCARLEPDAGLGLISRFQRRELYVDDDGQPTTAIDLTDGQPPVVFSTDGLERLLRDVRSPHLGADSFTWPPPDDTNRAPYRGWLPYDARDAAVFFGRDTELAGALKAFDEMHTAGRSRLFVILGPSGTGKSSFLRAGILPRLDLQRERFTVLDIVRPGRGEALTGDSGLAKAIVETRKRLGLNTPALGEVKTQWITDAAKVRALLVECQQRAAELSNDPTAAPTLVVPLDQAEELFSAEAGAEAITLLGLIRDLLAASENASAQPALRVIVAATIRTDRYEAMQTAEELSGVDTVLFNDLKPMRPARFRQVIEGPARRSTEGGRPLSIESQLVDRLLDDAADHITEGGDTLPLLSGTLSRLFADYGDTGELTVHQYEQIGGIGGVVETEINKILSADPAVRAGELAKLKEAFIPWLATVSDHDQPMRRIALWADLPESSRGLIEKLVDARILIRDTRDLGDSTDGGQSVVEIALESFLRQWHELAGWLAEQAEDLKAADVLLRDADRWQASNRDPIYLYPGPLLEQAEKLAATATFGRKLEPTREFLVGSRQLVSQQQREKEATLRRNTLRLGLVLAVTVVVAVVAVLAFFSASKSKHIAQTNARDAIAQKLESEATAMLANTAQGDDVRAIQELLAAHKLAAHPGDGPLLDALVKRSSTDLISNGDAPVIGVASAEGGHLLAVADSNSLRVWDTGSPTWRSNLRASARFLPVESKTLTSLAISADGRALAAGSDDGNVHVWNLDDPQPKPQALPHPHQGRVTAVALSRDGRRVASGGADGIIDLSALNGTDMRSITTRWEPFTVAFDPAGNRLAAGGSDGAIRVWNVATLPPAGGEVPADTSVLNAHDGGVMSVTFSPNGNLVASGGADAQVRLWTGDTLSPLPELTTLTRKGHTAAVTSVAFNYDGTRVVSGSGDKTVQLWDVNSRQRIGDPLVGHQGLVLTVAFVAGTDEIVSGGNEHALRFWNGVVGQPLSQPLLGHQGPVTSVAISPDGHTLASAGVDGTVRLWDAGTGAPIREMPGPPGGAMTRVAFSRTGDMVASGSFDGKIRLWQLSSDTVRELHTGRPISAIALSRDGDRLASAGMDGQITIWDLQSGQPTPFENPDHAVVFDVAFDALGDRLASGGVAGILRVWDRTGRQLWESDVVKKLPADFRSDAGIAEGRPGAVLSVAFSPDGQRVASASADTTAQAAAGVVQRWDANGGNPLGEPTLLGNAVMGLALSAQTADPPGDRIVAGSFDPYIVQLWNAGPANGDRLTLPGHEAQVVSVAISADGGRIVSGSVDGTVRIWPNPPGTPLSAALCDKLSTTMSPRDWDEWVSTAIPYQNVCPALPPTPDPPPG